ncbi:MAG: hypothetical protein HZB21_05270 [Deltaproteobacteria bacterium]|nr:hypothetical protein [Deltaproteobacteria bacterium]
MASPIQALEEIQRIDLEISAIEEEGRGYLSTIERNFSELKAIEEEKKVIHSEIEALNAQIRDVEEKARQSSEKVKKNEERLSQVKNVKESNAVTREMNEASKSRRQAEQEMGSLNSKLSGRKAVLDAVATAARDKEAEINRITGEMESRKSGWEEGVKELCLKRDGEASRIGSVILSRYETIRSKRGGRAVVPVRNEACQGCFIHIPPQVYIQLKKGGDELMTCPHCHRILYAESQIQPETV